MTFELERMLAGELYDALDPELVRMRERARDLCHDLNATLALGTVTSARTNEFTGSAHPAFNYDHLAADQVT